jgi:hypothetical protein
MARLKIIFALTFIVTLSCSYYCIQIARASILDVTTKHPIDSVKYYKKNKTE